MKKEKMEISEEAHDYRVVRKGLNIEGTCVNPYCPGFQKHVLTKIGFGTWKNVYDEISIKCPLCGGNTIQPWEPYFYKCKYNTTIKIKDGKDIHHKGDVEGEDIHHWDIYKKNIEITGIEVHVMKLDGDNDEEPEIKDKDDCCCLII
jgi:hypothetical protein